MTGLEPAIARDDVLSSLRNYGTTLTRRSETVRSAIAGAVTELGTRRNRLIARDLAMTTPAFRLLGVLTQLEPQDRRTLLRFQGGLSSEEADTVLALAEELEASPTLLRELSYVLPSWFGEPPSDEARLKSYLKSLVERTSHIEIIGIGTAAGDRLGAVRYPIERIFTPLWTRSYGADATDNRGDHRTRTASQRVRLSEILPIGQHLLIVGDPGAGKSTFVNFVASLLARDLLGDRPPEGGTWRESMLGLPAHGAAPVPVLIRLSDLAGCLSDPDLSQHRDDDRRWITTMLDLRFEHGEHGMSSEQWEGMLDRGEAALLLDGLDEVADEGLRRRLFAILADITRSWGQNLIAVTTRPLSVEAVRDMGFKPVSIERFTNEDIRAFVDRWVPGLFGEQKASELSVSAREYRDSLLKEIVQRPDIRQLAANPVMLTCLCVVHFNEGRKLPEGRANVYKAAIKWLLGARRELRAGAGFNDSFALRSLARLALAMMGGRDQPKTVRFGMSDAIRAVLPEVERDFGDKDRTFEARRDRAREWLGFECLWSGIIEQRHPGEVRFSHLTFQEFLAARRLSWMEDAEEGDDAWWPSIREHLFDVQWHETLELLPSCLLEGGQSRVDKLLTRILDQGKGARIDLLDAARVVGTIGRLLPPLDVEEYRPRPDVDEAYDEARQRIIPIFELEGAKEVPWRERIAAARALGRAGDPRLVWGDDYLFLPVPGTSILLGRFPVTVQELRRFVDDRGYERERWWLAEGWRIKTQEGWTSPGVWESQLNYPNRPVVAVSWYEADAYCRWLSEIRGQEVRLPTQAEWEAAAYPDGRKYPWGWDAPTPEHASYGENTDGPTPVGVYPLGAGPYGHFDLGGNVWEWCLDEYEPKEARRKRLRGLIGERAEGRWFVLQGGSWLDARRKLRNDSTRKFPGIPRDEVGGFRVALASAGSASPPAHLQTMVNCCEWEGR